MSVTIKDVAQKAGVSIATVSRVLNGKDGISDELEYRVRMAVQELGYHPNLLAQGLRRLNLNLIGVMIPSQTDMFFMRLLKGLEDQIQPFGYNILITTTQGKSELELYYAKVLMQYQVSAIVVAPGPEKSLLSDILKRTEIPVIAVNEALEGINADSVFHDNVSGARTLVDHLASLGHEKIAFLSGRNNMVTAQKRLEGYLQGLEDHALHYEPDLVQPSEFSISGGLNATRRLLDTVHDVTAIIAGNNQAGIGCLFALKERGICLPGDMSLALFGDLDYSELLSPPVTALQDMSYKMGREAGRLVLRRLSKDDDSRGEVERVRLKPKLIVRGSTAPIGQVL